MRRLFCLMFVLFALPLAHAGLLDSRPSATLGALNNSSDFLPVREAFRLSLNASTREKITLRFVASEGYYLYRHRFQFKTEPADMALPAARLPQGEAKHDEFFGDVEVYHGVLDVELPRNSGDPRGFTLVVTYQGCADKGLCYPPETERLTIPALADDAAMSDTAPGAVSTTATSSPLSTPPADTPWRWSELVLFFLGGLALTFTPCVLPMLPIISGYVLSGQLGGRRGFQLSLTYVLAMAACFALLGALMGMFGAQLNLQARLQSAWVLVPFSLFFVVFALAMFGVFELKLPQALSSRLDRVASRTQGGSLWGAAVLGVISSLLVSPCVSAPLAGALLYISASGDAAGGALKLLLLGLGMGTPLMLVATGGAAWLPRSGPWLVTVKNTMGVLLLAVALGMLGRVLPGSVTLLLMGFLWGGVAVFLGALERHQKSARQRLAQLLGLFLLVYALACWYGALSGQDDPLSPLGRSSISQTRGIEAPTNQADTWQTVTTPAELDKALAQAREAGQPVLLDWYADWCISCKVIEREVLHDANVLEKLEGYRLIRFDITQSNAEQRALLDRYQLFGPPALLFFAKDGRERREARVVGEIDASGFMRHLALANDPIR